MSESVFGFEALQQRREADLSWTTGGAPADIAGIPAEFTPMAEEEIAMAVREAKLEALRRDIAEGLASGPAEPLDMQALKADARKRRNASRHGA